MLHRCATLPPHARGLRVGLFGGTFDPPHQPHRTASLIATGGIAGQALMRCRLAESAAKTLPGRRPPAWVYLHGLKSPLSSTALRAARIRKSDTKTCQTGH